MQQKFKNIIKYTDFFYSTEMLRCDQEQEYRTITGGILSLGIIITTLVGFASMIGETLNLSSITTVVEVRKYPDPSNTVLTASSDNNFMFGVQIWKVNTTGQKRYFDVILYHDVMEGLSADTITPISLVPCTPDHWNSLPQIVQKFDQLVASNWLCPPIGTNLELYGKYSSNTYSSYVVQVSGCKNSTEPDRPCASQQQIDALFQEFQNYFYFTIYYINPIINSDQKDYKSYYFVDQNYVIFGNMVGSTQHVYFTDYTVQTDNSIWPFESWSTDQGALVESLSINHPFQAVPNGIYAQIYLAKSENSITYTRQVQKISFVLSFIGGMIGAISTVLFIVKIYTNFAYQISIASDLFYPEKENSQLSKEVLSPDIIKFIKFYAYSLMKMLGMEKSGWKESSYVAECQEEVINQLNIKLIIKRMLFIEHCLSYLFQDYELEGLQFKRPATPAQIRNTRKKCQFNEQRHNSNLKQKQNDPSQPFEITLKPKSPPPSNQQQRLAEMSSPSLLYQNPKKPPSMPRDKVPQKIMIEEIVCDSYGQKNIADSDLQVYVRSLNNSKSKNAVSPLIVDKKRMSRLVILNRKAREGRQMSRKIWETLPTAAKAQIIEKTQKLISYPQESL